MDFVGFGVVGRVAYAGWKVTELVRAPLPTSVPGAGMYAAGDWVRTAVGQFANAAIPVIARPRISAWTSCVPS
jgi:hypothetical protein